MYNLPVFTGLVQCTGKLVQLRSGVQSKTLVIEGPLAERDLALGASVAVSGVCLTVTSASSQRFELQAAFETLRKTSLGDKRVGDRLNLEPSLRVGDALGGHLVSGHVDGVGTLRAEQSRGDARELWFDVPPDLLRFIAIKGSICVEGVSLTVNDVDAAGFCVGVIPHTLQVTTLGGLAVRDRVNLEVDLLARYVARILETGPAGRTADGLTWESLQRAGFTTKEGSR